MPKLIHKLLFDVVIFIDLTQTCRRSAYQVSSPFIIKLNDDRCAWYLANTRYKSGTRRLGKEMHVIFGWLYMAWATAVLTNQTGVLASKEGEAVKIACKKIHCCQYYVTVQKLHPIRTKFSIPANLGSSPTGTSDIIDLF